MLLEEPNLYNAVNWLTMGAADTVSGAIAPEEPLSLQHWMDSYATVMAGYGAWKSGKAIAKGKSYKAADAGNKKINLKGNIADEKYVNGTLSNVEARKWYLEQEMDHSQKSGQRNEKNK